MNGGGGWAKGEFGQRGSERNRRLETKTEGEKAPPPCSFSFLLALACGKCKAAG